MIERGKREGGSRGGKDMNRESARFGELDGKNRLQFCLRADYTTGFGYGAAGVIVRRPAWLIARGRLCCRRPHGRHCACVSRRGNRADRKKRNCSRSPHDRASPWLRSCASCAGSLGGVAAHTPLPPLKASRIVDDTARLIRAPEVRFVADEIGLEAFGHNIENISSPARGLEARASVAWPLTWIEDEADKTRSCTRAVSRSRLKRRCGDRAARRRCRRTASRCAALPPGIA